MTSFWLVSKAIKALSGPASFRVNMLTHGIVNLDGFAVINRMEELYLSIYGMCCIFVSDGN